MPRVLASTASNRYGVRASVGRSLGPCRRPPIVVPALRFLLVGHCDTYLKLGPLSCVSGSLSYLPIVGRCPPAVGVGRSLRLLHGVDLRPHSLGRMPTGPGMPRVPVLAAVELRLQLVRPGIFVATPNFRHPVTFARDALVLDDLATAASTWARRRQRRPGCRPPSVRSRGRRQNASTRFEEFLQVLQPVVDGEPATRTSLQTAHYGAAERRALRGRCSDPSP